MRSESFQKACVVLAVASTAMTARADSLLDRPHALFDPAPQDRSQGVTLWGSFYSYAFCGGLYCGGYGAGIGARYTLPVLKDGFLTRLNDSFDLEVGADVAYPYFAFVVLQVPVEARWTFYLMPFLSAYAKLGAGAAITPACRKWACSVVGPLAEAALGVTLKLSTRFALRVEASTLGLHAGVGVDF